jgi:hypothetical protein
MGGVPKKIARMGIERIRGRTVSDKSGGGGWLYRWG